MRPGMSFTAIELAHVSVRSSNDNAAILEPANVPVGHVVSNLAAPNRRLILAIGRVRADTGLSARREGEDAFAVGLEDAGERRRVGRCVAGETRQTGTVPCVPVRDRRDRIAELGRPELWGHGGDGLLR